MILSEAQKQQAAAALIEELKMKELAAANAMLYRMLRDNYPHLDLSFLAIPNLSTEPQPQQFPTVVDTSAAFEKPTLQPAAKVVDSTVSSPLMPSTPVEFAAPTNATILSSTSSSPISSPSTSSTASSVDSGLESEDSDRRPHQCPDCLKRFRFKSNLFEHKTLHQHSTPFVCPFCAKTCRLKGNLKKHLQVHVSSSEALEELWKSRFSRSSGRPRKQPLPAANGVNGQQQPPPSTNLHRQQMPTPVATYPPNYVVGQFADMNGLQQALHDLGSLLTLSAPPMQALPNQAIFNASSQQC